MEKLREKAMAMDAEDVTVGTASILSICSKSAGVSLDVTNLRDKYSKLRRILQTKVFYYYLINFYFYLLSFY